LDLRGKSGPHNTSRVSLRKLASTERDQSADQTVSIQVSGMTPSRRYLAIAFAIGASIAAQSAIAGLSLVVTPPRNPPPALRIESRGPAPFRDAVWIDGRWDWHGGQYVWISGHWQRAPTGLHHWKAGAWAKHDGDWVFTPGQWF